MTAPLEVPIKLDVPEPLASVALHRAPACVIVIFGAFGDLAHRKLAPAIFHLVLDGALPPETVILGLDRGDENDASFRARVRDAISGSDLDFEQHAGAWQQFEQRLFYLRGDFKDTKTYRDLQRRLEQLDAMVPGSAGHLFHLAIPPSLYIEVIEHLSRSGVVPRIGPPNQRPWTRMIIEKPFGHDYASACALNRTARKAMAEHQIYRIDHYLGKETVQNLLVLRFANSIFEPVWNRHHVHHVQITAAESLGIGHRGGYYEEAGVVRDMFQNHLLQLLTLTAMEPPAAFSGDGVRDEKVKVLHSIRPFSEGTAATLAVRGQYGPGVVGNVPVPGYREEGRVAPDSVTPTFAALRFEIDNWRWKGVPFFLRSGKRLAAHATEIAIQFCSPPHLMFARHDGETIEPNVLVIRIQPREGVAMRFEVKAPGFDVRMASVNMNFDYARGFSAKSHDAYETLLLDCMLGDATLFTRSDAAETAWQILDPLLNEWAARPPADFPNYAAGTWGPAAANDLLELAGAVWRRPKEARAAKVHEGTS